MSRGRLLSWRWPAAAVPAPDAGWGCRTTGGGRPGGGRSGDSGTGATPRLLTPKSYGWGYDLNVYWLVHPLQWRRARRR